MNVKYLLKCIFASENKSLTSAGELWEVKSRNAIGDEEYAHLQTLLRMFPLGIPVLLFEEKSTGEDWLWLKNISMESVDFCLRERSSGVLVVCCSTGELYP